MQCCDEKYLIFSNNAESLCWWEKLCGSRHGWRESCGKIRERGEKWTIAGSGQKLDDTPTELHIGFKVEDPGSSVDRIWMVEHPLSLELSLRRNVWLQQIDNGLLWECKCAIKESHSTCQQNSIYQQQVILIIRWPASWTAHLKVEWWLGHRRPRLLIVSTLKSFFLQTCLESWDKTAATI